MSPAIDTPGVLDERLPTGEARGIRPGGLEVGVVAACLLIHALAAWVLRTPGIGTGQDDAIYLLLGRALQHLDYRDVWLVGHPFESRYPPGFPALLALTGAGTGIGVDQAIAVNILCSVAALLVFYRLVRREAGALALLLLPVVALNPALAGAAGKVASEPPYLLCSLLVLSVVPSGAGRRATAWAVGLAIAAALTRSIGIVLVGALGLYWLAQRRWRPLAGLAVAASLTVGVWIGWTVVAPGQYAGHSYVADALLGSDTPDAPAPAADGSTSPPATAPPAAIPDPPPPPAAPAAEPAARGLVARVRHNAVAYATGSLPAALAVPTLPGTWIDNLAATVVIAIGLVAGVWTRWRRDSFLVGYLALYALLLLAWPYALTRFVVPVVPLALWLVLAGLLAMIPGRWRSARRLLPGLLAVILALSGASKLRAGWAVMRHCDRAAPRNSAACFQPEQLAFFRGVEALDTLAPAAAPLLTAKAATIYWLTGRQSVQELEAASLDPAGLTGFLDRQGVRYIFLSRIHLDQRTIAAGLQPGCGALQPLAEPASGALVLRRGAPPGPGTSGCEAVARFLAGPWAADD